MQSSLIVTIQLDIRQMLPAINAAVVGLSAQALSSKIRAETSAAPVDFNAVR